MDPLEGPPQASNESLKIGITQVLNDRRKGIQMMRSAAQFKALDPHTHGRQLELGRSILGQDCEEPSLYQILDDQDLPYHLSDEAGKKATEGKAVRGLRIIFTWQRLRIDCFIMDNDSSKKFYDKKSESEQMEFAERHVARNRSAFVYEDEESVFGSPDAYFVIAEETPRPDGASDYQVKQLVSYEAIPSQIIPEAV